MSNTILCHCHVITEDMFLKAIEDNKRIIADLPLNKAAGFVFNKVRDELSAGEDKRPDGGCGRKCPRPCMSSLQIMINEMEAEGAVETKGYDNTHDRVVADAIAGLLLEMK